MIVALVALLACGDPAPPAPADDPKSAKASPTPAPAPEQAPAVTPRPPERRATSPAAHPPSTELARAREVLANVVAAHALVPDNPWAVAHGMLALGTAVKLNDGRDPIDALFADYAEPFEVGGDTLLRFPQKRARPGATDIRIEPHTDLLLKAFTEGDVAPDRVVRVGDRELPVLALYRGSLYRTWVDGEQVSAQSWNDTPWTLQALAAWAPDDLAWTATGGRAMTLDGLTSGVVAKLHAETAFLRDAQASGGTFRKQGQGIFKYTCGGAHLLQGAGYAVARGFGTDDDRQRVQAQVPLHFWRFPLELAQVDAAMKTHPEYGVLLLSQRLKFVGHFLETMHKLAALGLYVPDDGQRAVLATAEAELVRTVTMLEKLKVLDNLGALATKNEQTYLDLVGDAAHAVRGVDLATGKGTIAY